MNEIIKAANKVKFETIAKNLEKRNMKAYYCDTAKEAVEKACSLIASGSSVGWGGSISIRQMGLLQELEGRKDLTLIDAFAPVEPDQAYDQFRKTLLTDVFLMSTNAITLGGELVNIDGTGNRMAAFILGPKEVLMFVGANKIAVDEEDARARVKAYACTANAVRLKKEKTPCVLTGKCGNCLIPECMCSHTIITRYSKIPGRVKVFLVNENLGY